MLYSHLLIYLCLKWCMSILLITFSYVYLMKPTYIYISETMHFHKLSIPSIRSVCDTYSTVPCAMRDIFAPRIPLQVCRIFAGKRYVKWRSIDAERNI